MGNNLFVVFIQLGLSHYIYNLNFRFNKRYLQEELLGLEEETYSSTCTLRISVIQINKPQLTPQAVNSLDNYQR